MNYKGIYIAQSITAILFISVLLIYSFASLNETYHEIRELQQLESQSSRIIRSLEELKKENADLKKKIPGISPEKTVFNVLTFINNHPGNIDLYQLSKAKVFPGENVNLIEFSITLKGGFKALLEILFEFEKRSELGKIVHLDIQSKKTSKYQNELYSTLNINVLSQNYDK